MSEGPVRHTRANNGPETRGFPSTSSSSVRKTLVEPSLLLCGCLGPRWLTTLNSPATAAQVAPIRLPMNRLGAKTPPLKPMTRLTYINTALSLMRDHPATCSRKGLTTVAAPFTKVIWSISLIEKPPGPPSKDSRIV